ncbi:ribosome small subunit-dependent GTPase A [Peribacillus kribbensis]|uniref:ribosome small subunit-dependent GTPase A n=1 Tax=Peribacillus kribbensis TaxID=356658 RepID=UPI00040CCD6D|nr:ribosome small subunit-dependent GTPase A [Peribacillus kribbensis]
MNNHILKSLHESAKNELLDVYSSYKPGRIVAQYNHVYRIACQEGVILCEMSGKLKFNCLSEEDYPAVGDWTAISIRPENDRGTIHGVLPRKSKFSRLSAGTEPNQQLIAVNIDYIFIVLSLNQDFNIRRIERYLISVWESGATPVIILNKSDLCGDLPHRLEQLNSACMGVPVIITSALQSSGYMQVFDYLKEGMTGVFAGSSGVGKSTLINLLLGDQIQEVSDIRADDGKGKHTTTHRELFALKNGAYIIDIPGMREFGLWESDKGFSESFRDIEDLSHSCFYNDCAHKHEPDCAVLEAIRNGSLEKERLANYHKLQREQEYLTRKNHKAKKAQEKNKHKKIAKEAKSFKK